MFEKDLIIKKERLKEYNRNVPGLIDNICQFFNWQGSAISLISKFSLGDAALVGSQTNFIGLNNNILAIKNYCQSYKDCSFDNVDNIQQSLSTNATPVLDPSGYYRKSFV